MPSLRRRDAPPLLSMVNGKPHATQQHHHDRLKQYDQPHQLQTPPSTNERGANTDDEKTERRRNEDSEEAIMADPVSSEDEKPRMPEGWTQPTTAGQLDGTMEKDLKERPAFKRPGERPQRYTGEKRKSDDEEDVELGSDGDGQVFTGARPAAKRQKGSMPQARRQTGHAENIFARPKHQHAVYGSQAQRKREREEEKKAEQERREREQEKEKRREQPPVFQMPTRRGLEQLSGKENQRPGLVYPRGSRRIATSTGATIDDDPAPLSPDSPISDAPASSDLDEEVHAGRVNLPHVRSPPPTIICNICDSEVDFTLHETFQDTFKKGRALNYAWQRRFCHYHKQHSAKQRWKEKGYPQIDWDGLSQRMGRERHMRHLRAVIAGDVPSTYRAQLARAVKKGGVQTAVQALRHDAEEEGSGSRRRGGAGYYGPRGEKAMTEHILAHLHGELRDLMSRDRTLAKAGVAGGVSGLVQAVVVPELAVSLVREDLEEHGGGGSGGQGEKKDAVRIVEESGELGELLNPEEGEGRKTRKGRGSVMDDDEKGESDTI